MGISGYIGAMTDLAGGLKAGIAVAAFFLTLHLPTAALAWTYPEEPEARNPHPELTVARGASRIRTSA